MGAAAILNCTKTGISGCIQPVYCQYLSAHTKFDANRSRISWDRAVCVFPKWRPSAILDLLYPNYGQPTTFPLMGCILPANGIQWHNDPFGCD